MHPGGISTDQQKQAVDAYGVLGNIGVVTVRPFPKDPVDEGCRPMLFATTSNAVGIEQIDGGYIVPDCKVTEPSSKCNDEHLQESLWAFTEKTLRDKLGSSAF
ncbi:hypothetical protein PWT90_04639 [Aphanocladium album]|nr:hypothetical protein PWT90_04639 [Aphanocladium album]